MTAGQARAGHHLILAVRLPGSGQPHRSALARQGADPRPTRPGNDTSAGQFVGKSDREPAPQNLRCLPETEPPRASYSSMAAI